MRAVYLVRNGNADRAFEIRETDTPSPGPLEILIRTEGFGLNFADVMARLGIYPDAPPKPAILGYDVVGHIEDLGEDVKGFNKGDRVTAMTRFGGYSEYATTDYRGVAKISADMDSCIAASLTTQGCTASYMAYEMVRIFPGDEVLVHAAAGGVGSLLCQMAKEQGATVYGTAGSQQKIDYLNTLGVDHPIAYRTLDFSSEISKLLDNKNASGLDIIFDPIGGNVFKKGMGLLGPGGRIVLFGASSLTSAKNIIQKAGVALNFGLQSPIGLLSASKSIIGVNMLRIADDKPKVLNRVLQKIVKLVEKGIVKPRVGGVFSINDLARAHTMLETRQTMGKLFVKWD